MTVAAEPTDRSSETVSKRETRARTPRAAAAISAKRASTGRRGRARDTGAGEIEIHPLTPERWPDLERLFGPRGAYGGCWCMYWRVARSEFKARQGSGNKRAFKAIVDSGEVPGVLAYRDGEVAGWCAIAPRSAYASLSRSRTLKPLDDRPVWSIVCFYVDPRHRGEGLVETLIEGAVAWARTQGATLVEGYPTVPRSAALPPVSVYMGLPRHFERAGFAEASRPSAAKAVMRRALRSPSGRRREL